MDYAWQRLPAADAGALESHLAGCPGCRALLEEERALGAALAAVPQVAPRRDLWVAVRARQTALDAALSLERPSERVMAPVIAERVRASRARRGWAAALSTAVAVMALMLAPNTPGRAPAPGAQILAQTLDTARQVTNQSDDPLADFSDSTLDVLSVASDTGTGEEARL